MTEKQQIKMKLHNEGAQVSKNVEAKSCEVQVQVLWLFGWLDLPDSWDVCCILSFG